MFNYVSVQTAQFLYSAIFGAALGVLYDLIRVARSYISYKKFVLPITDLLFWLFSIVALIAFVLFFCNGKMRWYVLFGVFCGAFVYVSAFGGIIFNVFRCIIKTVRKILEIITRPIFLLLRSIWHGGKSAGKKAEKKLKEVKSRCLNKRKAGRNGNKQKTKKAKRHYP